MAAAPTHPTEDSTELGEAAESGAYFYRLVLWTADVIIV
jgi:hypothetical protein